MAVVLTMTAPTREAYEAVDDLLDVEHDRPAGLIVHTACETGDGVLVTDVWESAADIQLFYETRLGKAIAETGVAASPPEMKETFRIHR
jgi:hypothetical protein